MKVAIGLLMLFIVTEQITSQDIGNATLSNETIASNEGIMSTDIFKQISTFLKKITANNKKNTSTKEHENATTTPSIDFFIDNSTQEYFGNNSITEENVSTSTAKQQEPGFNTTSKNDSSTLNITENESEKISTLGENSTTISSTDVSIHNATQKSVVDNSTEERNISTKSEKEEVTLNVEGKENSSTTTIMKHESKEISALRNNASDDTKEFNETEINSDYAITPELSTLYSLGHENNCKSYIKKLLAETFLKHADKLDPAILEDRKISIENNLLLSSMKGEVGFYDGKITGMSEGKLIGQCNVELLDDQIILTAIFSFDGADFSYKGKATFMEFGPKIIVKGKLKESLVEFFIAVPKDGGTGEVKSVHVKNIGRLDANIRGLGPINWAFESISHEIVNTFRFNFRRIIETELRNAMEEEIMKIKYP